ncbi:MAG: (2Fe-2S) ferredoxin domain-containing protein [Burkholderiales bacterium]|nr:(2Fe-2S) ferredoxin domain-containing protein [Burkholderiales bacterium]
MKTIMVCIKQRFDHQPSCAARGSLALATKLEEEIAARDLPLRIHRFPCLGMCEVGPNMKVVGGDLFHEVCGADLESVIQSALEDK